MPDGAGQQQGAGSIRILMLEDSATDAELMQRIIAQAGLDFSVRRVQTRDEFEARLQAFQPDIVMLDYALPEYDGVSALNDLARISPDTPAVVVSGMLGEETAVKLLKLGARDYVLKQNLQRLAPALQGALREAREVKERRRAERELREGCEWFRSVVDTAPDGIISVDEDGEIVFWNRGAEILFGYPAGDAIGRPVTKMIIEDDRERHGDAFHDVRQKWRPPTIQPTEATGLRKDGGRFPLELSLSIWKTGQGRFFTAVVRDITEKMKVENELQRMNRDLTVISLCNQALIRAGDEIAFLDQICDIIVNQGGYRLAWVGYAQHDESRKVRPVASKGFEEGYLEAVGYNWTDGRLGQGPAGMAIRSGKTVRVDDMLTDADFAPWRDEALKRGYGSVLALPLLQDGRCFGALSIHATTANAISRGEELLLEELALDLSYGIMSIRTAVRRRQAEQELAESERRYRTVVETSPEAIAVIDLDGTILMCNRRAAAYFGFADPDSMAGQRITGLVDPGSIELAKRTLADLAGTGKNQQIELTFTRRDGTTFPGDTGSAMMANGDQPRAAVMIIRDIAARKRSELELRQSVERLRRAMAGTVQAIALTVESRDPYTAGHQRRVADLAYAIAQEMGLDAERIEAIRMSGSIHDLGKIHVPAEILSKPGRLNPPEMSIIKTHSQVGFDILKTIEFPWDVAEIVREHHEKNDGSGYPQGLKGDEIKLEARILMVADVVEAMASHRPYRPARGISKALEEIGSHKGVLYDADVVEACLRLFSKGYTFESVPSQGSLV